ncbi:MAG: sporulation protein YqfC [Thermanaeromonas sp.]|uniref:sporulation protein YqfC n=1 Tax=Thermanaeromonas sp. TaxID=2003697 RepID=UPI0024401B25|nr:sporulation protein YqfC [Thermanaeromonas sp.]MCG0277556.1 sporulation protein YqfC [Thermanaeromonas sp.]
MPVRQGKGRKSAEFVKAKDHMASFLDLPQEAVCDWPRLTLIGNSRLLLENHRGVVTYESGLLRVNATLGQLEITGKDLKLKVLRPDAMAVEGSIKSIKFLERY